MANQFMPNIEDFVDSTPLLDSPEDLRNRAAEQGYLFFRSLLDAASVLDLRRQILAVCHKHGWLAPDTPLIEGVSRKDSLFIEGDSPEWTAFYTDVQRLRAFNALALHPAILTMFEILFGEKALPHSRNICRVIYPNATTHTRTISTSAVRMRLGPPGSPPAIARPRWAAWRSHPEPTSSASWMW